MRDVSPADVGHSRYALGVETDSGNGGETLLVDNADVDFKRLPVQEGLGDPYRMDQCTRLPFMVVTACPPMRTSKLLSSCS